MSIQPVVLGTGVSTIVRILSLDFIKLLVISIFLAAPLAIWAMQYWRKDLFTGKMFPDGVLCRLGYWRWSLLWYH